MTFDEKIEKAVLSSLKKFTISQNIGDILYFLAEGLVYHNPTPQIPTLCIGGNIQHSPKFNKLTLKDLFYKGIAYTYTYHGVFKEIIPVNPLTNRKLQVYYPCMKREFFDHYNDILYHIHSKTGDCYMTQEEWIAFMYREYDNHYGYSHFIGDIITHKGITGTLVKETKTMFNILTPTGIERKRK